MGVFLELVFPFVKLIIKRITTVRQGSTLLIFFYCTNPTNILALGHLKPFLQKDNYFIQLLLFYFCFFTKYLSAIS